ncbi:hypothetical protein AMIS_34950 [Actinoplanes missouriensis 431]|uniref:DUF4241 domain-containing protein n=1 Tax=Actinoplanes missouriensis (strain ATCC 14538 / DSM 43046 / CBS 188.64 / JCM 3121 / NBRC 102363 / NCIMB 12654 / NRRL B-3342 / UNCC 431) TaxID=512565 RepID=I0H6S8_ACTM4|nr:DUF4241 domain-containing protein [Actinoplanes missouriensis]BAL88715.1 hypothetical protein AMIS_34950 [Actinoplanes missouriensis 431]
MPYLPDLERLLTSGLSVEHEGTTFVVEPSPLGPVELPTGQVVACDPLVPISTPFTDAVTPGRYHLHAWVAAVQGNGFEPQRRIAALQLVIADEPVASWSLATLPGQDITSLGEDEFFGYGVDAGTGTLADQSAIEAISAWDYERIEDAFIPAQIPVDPIEAVTSKIVVESTGANVYVVGSGWGDGVYATYVGRSADGRITSFVTDFRVVPLP